MVEKSSFAALDDPPIVYATPMPPSAPVEPFLTEWSCPKCTLLNSISRSNCEACYFRKPIFSVALNDHRASSYESYNPLPSTSSAPPHVVGSFSPSEDSSHSNQEKNIDRSSIDSTTPPAESVPLMFNDNILDAEAEEDPYHQKIRRRLRRKRRMAIGGFAGCIVGSIILCFPGALLGGITGAWGARALSKRREKLKDDRLAKERLASAQPAAD
jgi:hypothetical protein